MKLFFEEPMKKHTSFQIGGTADCYIKAKTIEEIQKVSKVAKKYEIPVTILGNGSNVLVKDKGIRGITLKIDLQKMQIIEKEEKIVVQVQSGVLLGKLAQELLKREATGFEFAAGIPGSIGGAVRMNAGAYGGELKDSIEKVYYLDEEGKVESLTKEQCDFSYRHSIFSKKTWIILEATLNLAKGNSEQIKAKMQEYAKSRKEKQPLSMPSAGSTFKRGDDYITAKLIDECDLKGYCVGDAQVSTIHAGFVVNKGNATAQEVLTLVEEVKKKVKEKFDKTIELEIEVIGE